MDQDPRARVTDPAVLDPRVYVPQPGDVLEFHTESTGVSRWGLLIRTWHPLSKAMQWTWILTGTARDGVLYKDAEFVTS